MKTQRIVVYLKTSEIRKLLEEGDIIHLQKGLELQLSRLPVAEDDTIDLENWKLEGD